MTDAKQYRIITNEKTFRVQTLWGVLWWKRWRCIGDYDCYTGWKVTDFQTYKKALDQVSYEIEADWVASSHWRVVQERTDSKEASLNNA